MGNFFIIKIILPILKEYDAGNQNNFIHSLNLPTSSEVLTRLDYLFSPKPVIITITIATANSIFGSITIPVFDSSATSVSGSVSSSVSVISNYPFVV